MKMPAERIPPMMIAWVRSSVIVARKVTRKVSTPVLKRCENMKRIDAHSFDAHRRHHEDAGQRRQRHQRDDRRVSKRRSQQRQRADDAHQSRPARRTLMPTDERAMVAVAGTPPKKGMMMLLMPCATNSWLVCRRTPVIFEPTAPQSSDSIRTQRRHRQRRYHQFVEMFYWDGVNGQPLVEQDRARDFADVSHRPLCDDGDHRCRDDAEQ